MRSRYRGGAVVWEGRRREASPYPDQGASAGIDVDAAAGPLCFEPSRSGARAGRSGIRRRKDRPRSDCDGFPPPNWVPTVRFYPLGSGATATTACAWHGRHEVAAARDLLPEMSLHFCHPVTMALPWPWRTSQF